MMDLLLIIILYRYFKNINYSANNKIFLIYYKINLNSSKSFTSSDTNVSGYERNISPILTFIFNKCITNQLFIVFGIK